MKKLYIFYACLSVVLLCSCEQAKNTDTEFLFDTVVTLSATADRETLDGAFALCKNFEDTLSVSKKNSDISKINKGEKTTVKKDTAKLIKKGIYYGKLSNGNFDITVYPLSKIWDIKNEVVPSKDEIEEALQNIDYGGISVEGDTVYSGNRQIDLGGIAKGFIADQVLKYFKDHSVKNGIINLGGNIIVFGDKEYNVGIKKPFSDTEISATLKLKNKSVVTSGIYERCFEKDGNFYHHVLDTKTGYPAKTDLASATVINDTSLDGDALSTICLISGKKAAEQLIENTKNTEAVFIDKSGNVTYTSGIVKKGKFLILK